MFTIISWLFSCTKVLVVFAITFAFSAIFISLNFVPILSLVFSKKFSIFPKNDFFGFSSSLLFSSITSLILLYLFAEAIRFKLFSK